MNLRIVGTLAAKDLSLFSRNRFYALITVLGIVFYIVIYVVMPGSVDEKLLIGVYAPAAPSGVGQLGGDGVDIEMVDSVEALTEAVAQGSYDAGVALPPDIAAGGSSGQKPVVTLYFPADAPEEVRGAVEFLVTELAYQLAGQPLSVETSVEILGPDTSGEQIPARDRMRPLLAVALIMFEALGLATLISEEVESGTAQALLVTPARARDIFAAKGLMGVTLAFGQAALFLAIVGGMASQPVIILIALLLGAALVTGVGFLIASAARDMMSVMAWGTPALIILFIPAFGILFPGVISDWIKVVPSYYLVDTIHQAADFDAGWGSVWPDLLILLGFDVVLVWAGVRALGRRFR